MQAKSNNFASYLYSYPLMSGWPSSTSAIPNPWLGQIPPNSTLPRVDILENDSSVIYIFELPGADAQKLNLEVSPSEIFLTAPLATQKRYEEAHYIYQGRPTRDYTRVLSTPRGVVINEIKANFHNGILEGGISQTEQLSIKPKSYSNIIRIPGSPSVSRVLIFLLALLFLDNSI